MLGAGNQLALAAPVTPAAAVGQNSVQNVEGIGAVTGLVYDASTGQVIVGARVEVSGISAVTGSDGRYSLNVPAGAQPVDVSAYGYAPQSVTVNVVEDGTVTQGFNLQPVPSVAVTGKVLDDSGHGYPLYSKVSVVGTPASTYTNPLTGEYTLSVPKGVKSVISYTPVYPGYTGGTVTLPASDTNVVKDAKLKVDAACTAAGYAVNLGTPILNEAFDSASGAPTGWTVVDQTTQGGWVFNDVKNRGNMTGGTGKFAIVDSDGFGSGKVQDSSLLSPVVNLSAAGAPTLKFNSDYRSFLRDAVNVDVTTDGGATWTNVWHREAGQSQRGPVTNEVSLAAAAGAAAAQLRFHFTGSYDYWWELDNIVLQNRSCDPVAGGIVLGNTFDVNTGKPINGASVTSTDKPAEKTISGPTPDDPNVADGFYWLFSTLTGSHPFGVSKSGYVSDSVTANVVGDGVVCVNSSLKAPRLELDTANIEMFQSVGANRNTYVTVKNTGSAPVDVTLSEQAGATTPTVQKKGAGVRNVVVAGGVDKGFVAADSKGSQGVTHKPGNLGAVADGSWEDVASFPSAISDNTAVGHQGKVYSLGGNSDGTNTRKLWVYDSATNTWTAAADAPSARSKPQIAIVGGKLYAFGGFGATGNNPSVDVYDLASNTWTTAAATNPAPKAGAGSAVLGGKIYIVGGCDGSSCTDTSDVRVYDPVAGTFGTAAAYPHGVSWIDCANLAGKAYCAGGTADMAYTDGYSYDPAADAWSPIADLPIDLWGSAGASANGQFLLLGGITGQSTALTNRGFAYNPADNTWTELPESRVPTARGGGACGSYKVGGWTGPFEPSTGVEKLTGYDQCGEAGPGGADVPWLNETPKTVTLQPGKSAKILVQLTATPENGVAQPGDYRAELSATGATPYAAPKVDILMHALPPSNWSKLTGTVTGTSCAGGTGPVGATVQVNGTGSNQFTLKSSAADGKYQYWVPRGKYQIIVAKDGWIPQVKDQTLTAGQVHTVDFNLRPSSPCTMGSRLALQ
ncbi:kelch repeat-containing protein [Longispora sp. NPDC051575]|uniref:Kelch repeat-containing protein n=1 Tax=Longispora sp. NPDC051575 TaxID=3154943 RepID=UPI0034294CB5